MPAAQPSPQDLPDTSIIEPPSSRVEQFLEENLKKLLLGIALIALLVLAVALSRHFSAEAEKEAAERFTAAKTIADCDVIVQKHAGTAAAGNALLLKATLLWNEGKKESSIAALQEFVGGHPKHPLLAEGQLGLGSKQASLGDKAAARKTLGDLVQNHPGHESAAAAQMLLGDLLWAEGKVEEAGKIFNELPRNYPGSPFIQQAEERNTLIGAGLPTKEVDPPPAPKTEPTKPAVGPLVPPPSPSITIPPLTAPPSAPALPLPTAPPAATNLPAPPPAAPVTPPAPAEPEKKP